MVDRTLTWVVADALKYVDNFGGHLRVDGVVVLWLSYSKARGGWYVYHHTDGSAAPHDYTTGQTDLAAARRVAEVAYMLERN